MSLPIELISQFVKITNDEQEKKRESTVYGKMSEDNAHVILDGSDISTPVSTTVDTQPGERVTVLLKNHTATVTGNLSSPAARIETVKVIVDSVDGLEQVLTDTVSKEDLAVEQARIKVLEDTFVTMETEHFARLDFTNVTPETLNASYLTSGLIREETVGETIYRKLSSVIVGNDVIETKSLLPDRIKMEDLSEFSVPISGLTMTSDSIYSGEKSSVDSSVGGLYIDSQGQFSLGNDSAYITYRKDTGFDVSLNTITLGGIDVLQRLSDIETRLLNLEAGGVE